MKTNIEAIKLRNLLNDFFGDVEAVVEDTEPILANAIVSVHLKKFEEYIASQQALWREEIKGNIGMLRQWLNEDRITDKKMVTNEDLELWLLSKTDKEI